MKKKMVLGVVFVVLFVLQGQAVFAQNNNFFPNCQRLYINMNGRMEDVTNRGPAVGIDLAPGRVTIMIVFRDGSDLTYEFANASRGANGGWVLKDGIKMNSNTGSSFPGRYHGEIDDGSSWREMGANDTRTIFILDEQGQRVLYMIVNGL